MPTLPRESHQEREVAESFGHDAERYDRTRPQYPAPMVGRIVAASPGRDVLDVGTGTGIVARQFQAAGCAVLGVDPDARMAAWARQRGLDVEESTFETWSPDGRRFDAVIAGQAWHWVDPVAGAAKAGEVLRPRGRLALFWNVFQPTPELTEAFAAVYRRVLPDMTVLGRMQPGLAVYEPGLAKAADGMRAVAAFGEPERWQYEWDRDYGKAEWLDQVPTFGGFSQFPPTTQAELLAGIGAAIDAWGGNFTMRYTAVVITAAVTAD